jgi:hypothetical protein
MDGQTPIHAELETPDVGSGWTSLAVTVSVPFSGACDTRICSRFTGLDAPSVVLTSYAEPDIAPNAGAASSSEPASTSRTTTRPRTSPRLDNRSRSVSFASNAP